MNIVETLKRQAAQYIYKISRKNYLKGTIENIGNIIEEDDKITCYVTKDLLKRNCKGHFYELHCAGMNTVYEKSKELIDYYKLDKPVYYIFDGITFEHSVSLTANFSQIIFRNCTFTNGLKLLWGNEITLENNKYINWANFSEHDREFLYGNIDKLTIINDNFINSYELKNIGDKSELGINIKADEIHIRNSNICAENNGQINIRAKKTIIYESTIAGPEIYIDSDSIIFGKSLLKADNGIIIENKNCDCDIEVGFYNNEAPYVVYNGVEMTNDNNESLTVNDSQVELQEKRQMLLQTLENIKNECNKITTNQIEKVTENLKQTPIGKVLKR